MKNIVILAFNYGTAGRWVNGPGMCLHNFVTIQKRHSGRNVKVFSILDSPYKESKKFERVSQVKKDIDNCDVLIHWSGIDKAFSSLCRYASKKGKTVLVGPNLLDGVELDKEYPYMRDTKFNYLLVPNERIRFNLSKIHKVSLQKIKVFQVGPDLKLWSPIDNEEKEDFILWKGNSKHYAKDIDFALKLAKKMKNDYRFEFIGYPNPYNYEEHIEKAKRAKLYISTSISETMGLTLCEQWAAGIPSVTHPRIYLHGENYKTGIITNKNIDDYSRAIKEVMENEDLYQHLSKGCRQFCLDNFSDEAIHLKFNKILKDLE